MFFTKKISLPPAKTKPYMVQCKYGDHRVGRSYTTPRLRRPNRVEAGIHSVKKASEAELQRYKEERGILFPVIWIPVMIFCCWAIIVGAGAFQ